MDNDLKKILAEDNDGLLTYEYIVNNVDCDVETMSKLIENLKMIDRSGQFSASAARYLNAVGCDNSRQLIDDLVENVIERDREHRYLGDLLPDLGGNDCLERSEELCRSDRNFRRIFQRLYPKGF